jgi:predicted urease superfamily metal-dependent hydrolase
MSTISDRIKDLDRQIEELKSRWPTHSVHPAMLQRLDELEEELEKAIQEAREGNAEARSHRGL